MYDSIDIKEIDRISISDILDNKLDKNVLIDIRDKYEYLLSHINKAINIPYTYIITLYSKYLNFNDNYYIYCDNGIKSRKVCAFLNELGYNVVDLIGGYKEYIDG